MYLKPNKNEGTFVQLFYVMTTDGAETAEMFAVWAKEFDKELFTPEKIAWSSVESTLQQLTSGHAKDAVIAAYCNICRAYNGKDKHDMWHGSVKSIWVKQAMTNHYKIQELLDAGVGTIKEPRKIFYEFCYKEALYRLKLLYYGNDSIGQNNSMQLKKTIERL